jgi:hypothetical protein
MNRDNAWHDDLTIHVHPCVSVVNDRRKARPFELGKGRKAPSNKICAVHLDRSSSMLI